MSRKVLAIPATGNLHGPDPVGLIVRRALTRPGLPAIIPEIGSYRIDDIASFALFAVAEGATCEWVMWKLRHKVRHELF